MAPARAWSRAGVTVLLAGTAVLLSGCSKSHHLAEYDFRGGTLGVATVAPSHPEVFSGMDLEIMTENPLGTVLQAGSELVREASLHGFRTRLDSAAANVDVAGRMGGRVLDGAARYLRTTPVEGSYDVDYELELRVHEYGIVADSWTSGAYFSLDGDMLLLDARSGRIIWRTEVEATDPVRPTLVDSNRPSVRNVMTAVTLSRMSTEEIQQALEGLADFSADALTTALMRSLDDIRGG